MNFDLNIDNYTKSDYLDIFNLDKLINPTPNLIETKYKDLLNNIEGENMSFEDKTQFISFLTKCKNNLIIILNEKNDDYKLIDSDFIPTLDKAIHFRIIAILLSKNEMPMILILIKLTQSQTKENNC